MTRKRRWTGGVITPEEFEELAVAEAAVARAVAVDSFPMEMVSPLAAQHRRPDEGREDDGARAEGRRMTRAVYLVDGARTPFIKARGKPGPFTPVDLAVQCGRPLLMRQRFDPSLIDRVVLGCVNVIADEMNPARVAALRLGLPDTVPAHTVQINCGSGMLAIDDAMRAVADGRSEIALAGGAEALSHSPLVLSGDAVQWFARLNGARSTGARLKCSPG